MGDLTCSHRTAARVIGRGNDFCIVLAVKLSKLQYEREAPPSELVIARKFVLVRPSADPFMAFPRRAVLLSLLLSRINL